MAKVPFGALSAALAALGTALVFLAVELRADGFEPYVGEVVYIAAAVYFTALMVVVTWFRAQRYSE
ncbi:SCO3870 family protein [Streptantibioticus ferralitis]|uniref:SCO3870 family protein n=1 Tax=Streptantibioticus ferralitis TaxID=236510 RepID=A0ABT5Z433_9ACTN|nr:SCO3870 family protein [Streptantibioticus ferralitis]MDF2258554.1 SCO3870 family protein [Streptantibioticus ferralitis]